MESVSRKRAAAQGRILRFGEFRLDRVDGHLRRGDDDLPLRPKSFALLRYLAENPGRLITREEILRAVWPGVAVSDSVVRVGIGELRGILGDDPRRPRFLETVGRRGYRFAAGAEEAPLGAPAFVGRHAELGRLHELLARARAGRRQVVFVAGEPGIGKTALIDRFAAEVRAAHLGSIAQAQCVDLRGSTEPYLAVLELLGRLCGENAEVAAVLERWAPSWLLQLPGVARPQAMDELHRRLPTPTRERMLREFADALDVLARDRPVVVILEDLHWSDASTVDLLAHVAERTTPARLLVAGTYRPVDAVLGNQPLRGAVRDLLARGRALEMPLELLARAEVEAYLAGLLIGAPLDEPLAADMHAKTDGNPLFLVGIVDHLLEHGLLAVDEGRWRLCAGAAEGVPPSLRALVAREIEALDGTERAALDAGSVVGIDFESISVAAACEQPLRAVEDACARLAARGQLLRATGTTTWPDGSIGGTFQFLHALHRDTVYDRLPPAERARLHRAVGGRIEAGRAGATAALLASHFERGGDWQRAVRHRLAAIEAAKQRLADRDVVAHCEAVLALLARLPPSPERDEIEMNCSLDLGGSLLAVRGYATPEVGPLFVRARDLALALEQPQVEMMARGGLYTHEVMGGDQRRALDLAGDLFAMAERFPLPLCRMIGHTTLGCSHYNLGHFVEARRHFESARDAWQPDFPRLQLDQKVLFLGIGALALQQLGDAAAAAARIDELAEYGQGLPDPINAAHAFDLMSGYLIWAGDRDGAVVWAERSMQLAAEHGFPAHEALSRFQKGHALCDVTLQRESFTALQAIGYRVDIPAHRYAMAETLIGEERWEEAREELALALEAVAATGEARHLAELHRLRAACSRAAGHVGEARADLEQALAVARAQGSKLLEQRGLADLAALPIRR